MRVVSACWIIAFAAVVCAAPVPPPDFARSPTSPDRALHAEAVNYARNLTVLVDKIADAYVRPVSRVDMYVAALAGLYEAAGEPVPDALRADVRQAIKYEGMDLRELVEVLTGVRVAVCQRHGERPDQMAARGLVVQMGLVALYQSVYEAIPGSVQSHLPPVSKADVTPLLIRVRESLGQPESLRDNKALLASLQALPRALDPYCGLAPRHEFQRLDLNEKTHNTGLEFVGAPLTPIRANAIPAVNRGDGSLLPPTDSSAASPVGPLRVARVQPGSPAQRAGIRPGDMIIRIDGAAPESREFAGMFQRLRPVDFDTPNAAAARRLTIVRPGRPKPFTAEVRLAEYKAETVFGARRKEDGSWDYMLDPAQRIGYIRLGGIRRYVMWQPAYGSDVELREALQSLSASKVRGLVLDLRWCPGGTLNEARNIARLFLPVRLPESLPLYWQRDRSGRQEAGDGWQIDDPFTDCPIVVLINGETSGGGELIAAALQDHHRAAIAGQRTVGKASIQDEPLGPEMPFKVTVHTFLRPTGKNLQRFPDSRPTDDWGVRPDEGHELPLTAEAGRQLKEWWTLQTLRPPGTTEALPLDDPRNDPQRMAAVQMLLEMIGK